MNKKLERRSLSKGLRGRNNKKRQLSHKEWSFKPRLQNEAIVLNSALDIYPVEYFQQIVDDIRELITRLVRNHGFTDGAAKYNVIKNYTIALIEYRDPPNPPWLSTSERYNIPSKLGVNFAELLADYFRCTDATLLPKYYQVTITILNIVRMIDGLSDADYLSVTEKSKPIDSELLQEFETYVSERLSKHKFDPEQVDLNGYRFRINKNGPNSVPKMESAYAEAVCLVNSKLFNPFRRLCGELKVEYLIGYLKALNEIPKDQHKELEYQEGKTKLRLLAPVPDSGFKTRIVAIVDFWTQLVLEPVRDHVQKVIESEFGLTDFRLDQTAGVARMVGFQSLCQDEEILGGHKMNIGSLKFYDISSWTDRFHRDLQKIVMRNLFSSRLEEAWSQLVVHCKWSVKGQVDTIQYGQGQGMGTNGSFDIATLTDHLFINFIYDRKSSISGLFPNNRCYGKVGDDLWIYDPDDLIKEYYERINLPINHSKSKEYCELGSIAEFCSRTFLNGEDVSRISPKIISKSTDFRYIPTLLSLCASRGIQLHRKSFPALDNIVKGKELTYFDNLQPWIITLFALGTKERSLAKSLSIEYLTEGSWVTDDTLRIITDPTSLDRLLISYNIVKIGESVEDVKVKLSETMALSQTVSWNTWYLLKDTNFYMKEGNDSAKAFFKVDRVILPREIILLQRLLDQDRLVKSMATLEIDPNGISPTGQLSEALHDISVRSVYDQGNISYDVKRVYSTQFHMVKVLQHLNEDFTVLSFSDPEIVQNVKSLLINDLTSAGWGEELPQITCVPTES